MDETVMNSPELHTARTYRPIGSFGNIPVVGRWLFRFLPPDAHAKMNLDAASRDPLFAYAFSAAVKRTVYEYTETQRLINNSNYLYLFTGR
jgi:hypothetical protein